MECNDTAMLLVSLYWEIERMVLCTYRVRGHKRLSQSCQGASDGHLIIQLCGPVRFEQTFTYYFHLLPYRQRQEDEVTQLVTVGSGHRIVVCRNTTQTKDEPRSSRTKHTDNRKRLVRRSFPPQMTKLLIGILEDQPSDTRLFCFLYHVAVEFIVAPVRCGGFFC